MPAAVLIRIIILAVVPVVVFSFRRSVLCHFYNPARRSAGTSVFLILVFVTTFILILILILIVIIRMGGGFFRAGGVLSAFFCLFAVGGIVGVVIVTFASLTLDRVSSGSLMVEDLVDQFLFVQSFVAFKPDLLS